MVAHTFMRFSVDPWDPSYGVSLDAAEGQSRQEVDPGVEFPVEQWRPVDPPGGADAQYYALIDLARVVRARHGRVRWRPRGCRAVGRCG